MRLKLLSFLFILLIKPMLFCANDNQKKLVIILSTPRSLSTVFLRMMEERGDCFVSCEPGADAYIAQHVPEFENLIEAASPKTFNEVENFVLSLYQKHPFFCIKEMGYAFHGYLNGGDLEKLIVQKAHCVFLVRSPHNSLMSFYKIWPNIFDGWSTFFDYGALYSMYQYLTENTYHKPIIIMIDDLVRSPETVIKNMCNTIDIPFDKTFLSWNPLLEEMPSDTYGDKDTRTIWYNNALQSSCFGKQTEYICDSSGNPTFEEIANPEHREKYIKLYHKNIPYYNLFAQEAKSLKSTRP